MYFSTRSKSPLSDGGTGDNKPSQDGVGAGGGRGPNRQGSPSPSETAPMVNLTAAELQVMTILARHTNSRKLFYNY